MLIPQEKLRTLSLEALQALRQGVQQAIEYKARTSICRGSMVQWFSSKSGRNITLCVDNFGPKNVLGHEVGDDDSHQYNRKWRVSPTLLTVLKPPTPATRAPIGAGADRPASMIGAF